jgi:hypothetical protein
MVELKISFSKYDFFAVIIPGFLILVSTLILLEKGFFILLENTLNTFNVLNFVFILIFGTVVIILSYIIGLNVSYFSSWLIEGKIIKKWLKYPSVNLFTHRKSGKLFKSYRRSFSKSFQKKFKTTYNDYFKDDFEKDQESFSLIHAVIKENCPVSFSRLTTFISIYGLLRNLSLSIIYPMIVGIYIGIISSSGVLITIFIISLAIIPYSCFRGFLKFFRTYANELFKSFYVFCLQSQKKGAENKK